MPALLLAALLTAPNVGDSASDFTLRSLAGEDVTLSALTEQGPVVLVVLRGNPGYQCSICRAQYGQFLTKAGEMADKGAQLIFVYPGPGENLSQLAREFTANKALPENAHMLLDPDYAFTNQYELRWEAPRETAYPATFVIAKGGEVTWAKVSNGHGGRSRAEEVLTALGE